MKKICILMVAAVALAACGSQPQSAGFPLQAQPAAAAAAGRGNVPPQLPQNGQQPGQPGQMMGSAPASQLQQGGLNQAPTQTAITGPMLASYVVDITRLPIGDGRLSSGAQPGYLWQCPTGGSGGGAQATGAWFNERAGTWDLTIKPTVDGSVMWPHELTIVLEGSSRVIRGNDLPDHATGTYPVSPNDDAYPYDRNPNSISSQSVTWTLPANPTKNAQPQCTPAGAVGILLSGSYVFNAFDAENRDAVAHEIQDSCQGHPQASGAYHYHSISTCVDDPHGAGHSPLVGYAVDGFGIYGFRGENGEGLTDADLDACHGHTHLIEWDGQMVELYHYHATQEFPYTIGCLWGAPAVSQGHGGQPQSGGQQGGGQGGQPGGPPPGGGFPPPPPQP